MKELLKGFLRGRVTTFGTIETDNGEIYKIDSLNGQPKKGTSVGFLPAYDEKEDRFYATRVLPLR